MTVFLSVNNLVTVRFLSGLFLTTGRGGLVVTRLPAAREDRGSRRAAGKSLCFHENHCDTQLWARAAH